MNHKMKIMTKEEAIQILSTRDAHGVLCGYTSGVTEALDMSIEALSADTISREEAIHAIDLCRERKNKEIDELRTKWLEAKQKADKPTGEWIEYEPAKVYLNGEEVYAYMNNYTCSVCGGEAHIKYDYCPNCGARMI